MSAPTIRNRLLPLGITGSIVLAIVAGTGFGQNVVAKPTPDKTAAAAQLALSKGQPEKAIELAEAVVAASPREPAYRVLLGQAYLKAGRFVSAAATYDDAIKLGDSSAKSALGLALSYAATGRNGDAMAILEDWRDAIPAADLGLAMALSGEPARGSAILADALRNGENTPKLRQNLAYAYALDGRWREARIMMTQDVPADQIDGRISDWAAKARPEDYQVRVANLLSTPVRSDPGQPARLALGGIGPREQLAAASDEGTAVPQLAQRTSAPTAELPPLAPAEPDQALASYRPVNEPADEPAARGRRFAQAFGDAPQKPVAAVPSNPVADRSEPKARKAAAPQAKLRRGLAAASHAAPTRRVAGAAPVSGPRNGSHLVQLGSFFTEQGARRAWGVYASKNPELRNYRMTITKAQVRGKTYFRVAAAGFKGGQGASGLCGKFKARGLSCFAYAARNGMPGVKTRAAVQMVRAKVPAAAPKAAPVAGAPALARKR